jgi:hypothetical protein
VTKGRKFALAASAVATLFVGTAGTAAAALPPGGTFIDDDGTTHEGAIEAIAAKGITQGCSATQFCPDRPVTRGQMAAFLDRALHLSATGTDYFNDDGGSSFQGAINRVAAAGITNGCAPHRFCPNDELTRGQMAAFLDRAFHPPATSMSPFSDSAGPFRDSINRLAAAGITTGCTPGLYCPHRPVTRGQMATFLMRALGFSPIVPPPRPLPVAGNPDGHAAVPAAGREEDTSDPDIVIGNGTPAGCTSAAVVSAVAQGGIITFDCGPNPVTIVMAQTAKVFNDTGPKIVIDGGGLVTLSGGGQRRILYMNTCDQDQHWTTSHCQNQDHPQLTVQNLTFVNGNASGISDQGNLGGGGAIWVRGGRFKIVNSRFFDNVCASTGPDVGGAAVRVFSQYNNQPVYVVNSTFGGRADLGNVCSNGGGLSSIGVSWTVVNSLFSFNDAIGNGANPAQSGTPGGGSGGAIYNDGNTFTLRIIDTKITDNHANEGGGGIFFVSNDLSGSLIIQDSELRRNLSDEFENMPGIFVLAGSVQTPGSVIQ